MQESSIISISAHNLPEQVQNLHIAPTELYAKGNTDLLSAEIKRVGVVGARKYTPYGKEVTERIVSELAAAGVVIVSGLALGIDSLAHRAALKSNGKTIAVLPSGIQQVYPSSHRGLAHEIVQNDGLLLSEYDHDYRPMRHNFLERNRIIAALSDILIIPEAAAISGSLNTAGYALDLGIQIMAVPGNITSPTSSGTNRLIQKGAEALTSASEVLELLGIDAEPINEYLPENETEAKIMSLLRTNPISTEELSHKLSLSISELQAQLTILEIRSVIAPAVGKWYLK